VGIIFKGPGFYCTDHRSNTRLSGSEDKDGKVAAADDKVEAKTTETKVDTAPSTQKAG
jgi:hypothetical protein